MQFIGQLYESNKLPLQGNLAIQVYRCEDNGKPHIELIPKYAAKNAASIGVICNDLTESFISYIPVEDPIDQKTHTSNFYEYASIPDEHPHLHEEKIGGLFCSDGSDVPFITENNYILAQFHWEIFDGFIYLYKNELGFYILGPL